MENYSRDALMAWDLHDAQMRAQQTQPQLLSAALDCSYVVELQSATRWGASGHKRGFVDVQWTIVANGSMPSGCVGEDDDFREALLMISHKENKMKACDLPRRSMRSWIKMCIFNDIHRSDDKVVFS
ncbi:hypothetical protein Tco_1035142 [Tanacetum coccineum]